MATTQELIDDPNVVVTMREERYPELIDPPPPHGNDDIILSIIVTPMLFTEREGEGLRCGIRCKIFTLGPAAILRKNPKPNFIDDLCDEFNLSPIAAGLIADTIFTLMTHQIANWSTHECARIRTLELDADVLAFVHELPPPSEFPLPVDGENENDYEDDIIGSDFGDDELIRFEAADKDSVEALVRVTAGKAATCPVCLDEVAVGEQVTRLPCEHCFHRNCIVRWFERSKFCPLCRFQLP